MTASICWFCLLTCAFIDPAIDPAGSLDWMVGVLDNPTLEDLVTVAASAAISPGEFPSGSRETLDFIDNKSKDVLWKQEDVRRY